jgi:apolipoprotein N-acyltransferase
LHGATALLAGVCGLAVCGRIDIGHDEPGAQGGPSKPLHIAGLQFELRDVDQVLSGLDGLVREHPDTDLIVLSEYTFDEIPRQIRDWCRKQGSYLIVGGKEPAPNDKFYNTAFVIGPTGEIVFRQAKAVPIQFFKDGLPAPEQKLWDSPWGKIGICVCYDLSYTRVTDRLVKLGAQALIVPTMDVMDWGQNEHELHARVAPARAAEYGVPIFRVASSGISQWVDPHGRVLASAPCPGQGEIVAGVLELGAAGSLPWDRWLAPVSTALTMLAMIWLALKHRWGRPAAKPRATNLSPASDAHISPREQPAEAGGALHFNLRP